LTSAENGSVVGWAALLGRPSIWWCYESSRVVFPHGGLCRHYGRSRLARLADVTPALALGAAHHRSRPGAALPRLRYGVGLRSRAQIRIIPDETGRQLEAVFYLNRPGLGAGCWFASEIAVRASCACLTDRSPLRRAMFWRTSTAFFASSCMTTSRCATARRSLFALAARRRYRS
jgi:hypothetical protein